MPDDVVCRVRELAELFVGVSQIINDANFRNIIVFERWSTGRGYVFSQDY
jgi:hypothetical protein